MSKKSIADLERYKNLLSNKKEMVRASILNHIFLFEGGEFDFDSSTEMMEVLSNKINLLDYEINVALFSNSTKIEGEELSLMQVKNNSDSVNERIVFLEAYQANYLTARDRAINASAMTPYILATSLEHIESLITICHEERYSLEEKLEKEKEKIKIEVDMKNFVVENIVFIDG